MCLEQSERGEGREGTGQVVQGLVAHREDLGFNLREVGALEGCGQRRVWLSPV